MKLSTSILKSVWTYFYITVVWSNENSIKSNTLNMSFICFHLICLWQQILTNTQLTPMVQCSPLHTRVHKQCTKCTLSHRPLLTASQLFICDCHCCRRSFISLHLKSLLWRIWSQVWGSWSLLWGHGCSYGVMVTAVNVTSRYMLWGHCLCYRHT